jgi:hypothetical protein
LGPCEAKRLERSHAENPVVDPEEWPEAVDLILVTEFGRPVNVNSLGCKHFKPILKKADLPNIRLYDLRHTAATLALTVGVSQKVVSEQLGHTSAGFTLDVYSHVLPHMQDECCCESGSCIAWVVRGGKLEDVSFERLTRGLESLSELYDRYPQNVTNANQI